MPASMMAARLFVSNFVANKFRPPVPLVLFPREHAHAHPLCVSIDAIDNSSLTLTLQGGDKCLRASFEHGSNKRQLLGVQAQTLCFRVKSGLFGIHNVVNQGVPETLNPACGSCDI